MRVFLVPTFILLLFTPGSGVQAEQQDRLQKKKPPTLAVVRTWGDLFDQPILKLPDGVEIRAGLEAQVVPKHSAFLVYVLVNAREWKSARGGDVGPLSVELVRKNSKRGDRKLGKEMTKLADYHDVKHLLFAMTVAADSAGDYDLIVHDIQNSVVATTPITVTKEKAATWLDFWHPDKLEKEAKEVGDAVTAHWGVAAPVRAQPKCNGMLPLMTRPHQGREIPLTESLPRWSFDRSDGQLRLSATEKTLRLEAATAIFDEPSFEHWLFRIWINGKPFEPTVVDSRCGVAKKELVERLRDPAKVLIADWDFTAKNFGARKEDKVAIQLLYCPDGHHEIRENKGERKMAERMLRRGNRLPLATDKVEFVVR